VVFVTRTVWLLKPPFVRSLFSGKLVRGDGVVALAGLEDYGGEN